MTILATAILFLATLFCPRTVLITIWATNCTYNEVFNGWILPVVGTILMPYTTLAVLVMLHHPQEPAASSVGLIFIGIVCDLFCWLVIMGKLVKSE